ncbi:unnamed protein product [Schistocephalus solidus]|uniref:TauD domain-containing protein n=1 Tax=Schistocephalus solidus TaxID=70667 RepID=A0A183SLP6_SCHSO|nr:unnamed protein product [Schistocephalus solidus]
MLSSQGPVLIERSPILKRWAEHFRNFANKQFTISDAAIHRPPTFPTRDNPNPVELFSASVYDNTHDLFFTTNCECDTATEADMQRSIDLFTAGCAQFEVGSDFKEPRITVDGIRLKTGDKFVQLGGALYRNTNSDDEAMHWASKTRQTFG